MNIQISPLAEQRLTQILGDQPGYIKLFYDTEGCGCDGITVLKSVSAPDNGDIEVQAGSLPFLVSGTSRGFILRNPCALMQTRSSLPINYPAILPSIVTM